VLPGAWKRRNPLWRIDWITHPLQRVAQCATAAIDNAEPLEALRQSRAER